jgi:aryl-alcohol dehydrogenase-like predicted oxidoreductase
VNYRTLGRTGLKVSEVSIGGWLTYGNTVDSSATGDIVRRALDLGVNYVDTADGYAYGQCEKTLGDVLAGIRRGSYILGSKVFWPTGTGPNDKGLSRKHIHESVDVSLARLKTGYLDILYCHRYDSDVPLVETVVAMEDLVANGKILYWGVSCWTPAQVRRACKIATRYKPVVNQVPYNVFDRRIEQDVLLSPAKEGLGVVVFGALAQGLLTGKYLGGRPSNSRGANVTVNKFMERYFDSRCAAIVEQLVKIAGEAELTPGQLAIGWCLRWKALTSVLVGATSIAQIKENTNATSLAKDVRLAVEDVLRGAPTITAS